MTAPLHILQTCFSPSWGGLEMQALEISGKLRDRGHALWLATLPGSRLAEEARRLHITTLALPVSGYVHPGPVWRLAKFLRTEGIHIIHCQHSRDIATLVPAMQLSRRPVPVVLSKRMGSSISKKDLFHRYTYHHVRRVLAISNVIHRNVLATTPVTPDRVITFFDAVDLRRFTFSPGPRQSTRNMLGIHEQAVLIGFVGRMSPGKGHEELLQAARLLRDRGSTARFLVVGEASHGEEEYAHTIRMLAQTLGVQDRVTFTGYRTDIPALMASFDILAFPSHAESFGVVLIEAMAMGLPVVSTNTDGVVDIVADGLSGIMVPRQDARALADGLERLVGDPDLRKRMGRAGRARVEELFDQEKQITRLEQLYRGLL
jgi:glycosyltransferase involved in cell wall biosynthesis